MHDAYLLLGLAVLAAAIVLLGHRIDRWWRRLVDTDPPATMPDPLTPEQLAAVRRRNGLTGVARG